MSLLDIYRNNVFRKREEIAKLQDSKAKEQNTIASFITKINSAHDAISRTKSSSTISSKRREIQRYQKSIATSEKKLADIDKKIARTHKELNNEQKKVSREEEREAKKRAALQEKQSRQQSVRMRNMSDVIRRHDSLHKSTKQTLERLQSLPDNIVVLFLAANPIDQKQLRLDEEARAITEMIRKSEHRDSVQFETRWAVQPMDILQAINELDPSVVHFSGHGSDKSEIAFQSPDGKTKLVSIDAIVQMMMASSKSIRLVFFNTCYSDKQAEAITQHVEAAIGMNSSIGDTASRVFASQFYSALGFGHSLKIAFDQAKALVMMEGIQEENTPEVFIQSGLSSDEIVIVRPIVEGQS